MKVLDASLWVYSKEVMSSHRLQILVDRIPKLEELRFSCKDGCYFAEKDGYVEFYYWSGKGNDGGFYGREFPIIMEDGKKVVLKGAWSSRSSIMNKFFKQSIEISITENKNNFERGYTFFGRAITVELAKDVVKKFLPDWTVIKEIKWNDEIYYKVVRKDDIEDKRDNRWYRDFFKNNKFEKRYRYEKILKDI